MRAGRRASPSRSPASLPSSQSPAAAFSCGRVPRAGAVPGCAAGSAVGVPREQKYPPHHHAGISHGDKSHRSSTEDAPGTSHAPCVRAKLQAGVAEPPVVTAGTCFRVPRVPQSWLSLPKLAACTPQLIHGQGRQSGRLCR